METIILLDLITNCKVGILHVIYFIPGRQCALFKLGLYANDSVLCLNVHLANNAKLFFIILHWG